MKIVQVYKEKNNATSRMVAEMKNIFEKKLQNLEKENILLKEQVTKKDKIENMLIEETLANKGKKSREGMKHKTDEEETESTGDFAESHSRNVNIKKTLQHSEKNVQKAEGKKKAVSLGELSKRFVEKVTKRIRRGSTHSPTDRALKVMKGISKSPFVSWIIREVKPRELNSPILDKFDEKMDPITHFLQFK